MKLSLHTLIVGANPSAPSATNRYTVRRCHTFMNLSDYSKKNMGTFDNTFLDLTIIAVAYLLGSIPFAVVWSKVFGLADPRQYGSGNPGATNVLRSGNKSAAALTLLGDIFKGWLAVWLSLQLTGNAGVIALTCAAVFLGHLYPIFLKFHGGKGVATALGILLGISPWLGLLTILTWIFVAGVFRMSSLASIMSAILVPSYYVMGSDHLWQATPALILAIGFMSLMLLYRHADNIKRILKGTEAKLGSEKTKR